MSGASGVPAIPGKGGTGPAGPPDAKGPGPEQGHNLLGGAADSLLDRPGSYVIGTSGTGL